VAAKSKAETVGYISEPMPPGFQVVMSELEGPVFTDAAGHTFYKWPRDSLRNNFAGESEGQIECYDVPSKVTTGWAGAYPGGNLLPDQDHRPSCTQYWPPVYAAPDAKPVGNWTILDRKDGKKQWAYKGRAVYTSFLDHAPGETNGGGKRVPTDVTVKAGRVPVGPDIKIPPQFEVAAMAQGQMLVTLTGRSVYTYDKDTSTKSNCVGSCLDEWSPVWAPDSAVVQGDWSVVDRRGTKQWAFGGKPLYTRIADLKERSYEGSDEAGWHNVFLHRVPSPPQGFQIVDNAVGKLIAAPNGKTIYYYRCWEDTADVLACDFPSAPQEYRWAVCGGGDVQRCNKTFPYVIAEKGAKSDSLTWGTMDINPKTGRAVAAGSPDSLHVWTYRGRPIYTFAGDKNVGDFNGNGWGQDHGQRNGFMAFWMRDDFKDADGSFEP
jgi:predicted lipoprotein with Yx(FWY)xxD motif